MIDCKSMLAGWLNYHDQYTALDSCNTRLYPDLCTHSAIYLIDNPQHRWRRLLKTAFLSRSLGSERYSLSSDYWLYGELYFSSCIPSSPQMYHKFRSILRTERNIKIAQKRGMELQEKWKKEKGRELFIIIRSYITS